MHSCDAEATLEIILVDLLECLEYFGNHPVHQVIDGRETNLVKKMSAVRNTSLWSFNNSADTFTKSFTTGAGILQAVLPFNAAMLLPQILEAASMSWTITGQSLIWLLQITHLKSFIDG